jgi:hypothetical protein
MLMRTDPFRDFDRLTEAVFGTRARPAVMWTPTARTAHSWSTSICPA